MLLNSYEGFDYMDYSRYSMSTKDWGDCFHKKVWLANSDYRIFVLCTVLLLLLLSGGCLRIVQSLMQAGECQKTKWKN